jgi:ligand-binding SRPBCC domain-containing protein
MTVIELSTAINAPIERCFDLARSIDLHVVSTRQTGEQAIAGRTCGLIELGETVTWRARHLGVWQTLTSKITQYEYPSSFTDKMVEGAFKSMRHEHLFYPLQGQTLMKDIFVFESPYGRIGELFNTLFLDGYMKRLLEKRNQVIKAAAELPV